MPKAFGQKFSYRDHDTSQINPLPPVLNLWYEIFHAQDVRLLWCSLKQWNDEVAAKNLEIRWTVDGIVYFCSQSAVNNTYYYIYRHPDASTGGTAGIEPINIMFNAGYYIDKRGQDFKVEVRITSALGTNQRLMAKC